MIDKSPEPPLGRRFMLIDITLFLLSVSSLSLSFIMASSTHSSIIKRESLPTAGSVFFISSAGRVLKLPIPSGSYRDPLTWSWSKRFLAFFALQSLSIAVSFELNLPGLLIEAIRHEFKDEVWLTAIELEIVLTRY
jgi:hypothetical protein